MDHYPLNIFLLVMVQHPFENLLGQVSLFWKCLIPKIQYHSFELLAPKNFEYKGIGEPVQQLGELCSNSGSGCFGSNGSTSGIAR